MTNPIPPGLDRSPMGQWAKATRRKEHDIPEGFEGFYIYGTRFSRVASSVQTVIAKPDVFPYIALAPIGDTETEARLRWEADMMARHGETVQGVEGNPWIGWAKDIRDTDLSDSIYAEYTCRNLVIIWNDDSTKVTFLRPGDTAREAELRAQLSPDLDLAREGSGRVLATGAAPAPERVKPALQVGTPETWEEHVARRFRLTWCRSVLDEHYQIVAGQREKNDPPQHPLTTPPDTNPDMGSFWRRG